MKKAKFPVLSIIGIIFLSLTLAPLSAVQEAKFESLLGEWDVQTEGGQYTFVFIFSMEGETLKGIYKGTTGDVEMEDLSYKEGELSFTVNIDAGGQVMTFDYSATIEGDTLEGYLSMDYGETNITGKKRKKSVYL